LSVIVNAETTYYGRWENVCGVSDCEQVTIGIIPETQITSQPQDVNAGAGDNVSFSVIAEGDNVSYQWQKDNTDISGATDAIYAIDDVQFSDAGNYHVVVNGTCGSVTSNNAVLDVSSSIINDKESEILIFPNPSEGSFVINFSDKVFEGKIKIADITGKTIYFNSLNNTNKFEVKLNNVSQGLYLLEIVSDRKKYYKKIIIR